MWFRLSPLQTLTLLASLLPAEACKKGPSPSKVRSELPSRHVARNAALFFTYVDTNGVFATTDKPERVPELTRRVVRIMGRTRRDGQWRNDTNVDVVDLGELLVRGEAWTRAMSREAFESTALAQLPPGDACPLAGPHGPPLAEEPGQVAPPDEPPIVILYGTGWCKPCMAARQYLRSNRIPFTSRNVERDATALEEVRVKAERVGTRADRVPILDVRGRLLVGFDETRMDGMLADW